MLNFFIQGALPATVGVIGGRVCVGLSDDEIEHLSKPITESNARIKVSRRDFPKVITSQLDAGTTVSGTLAVASLMADKALPIFVTGNGDFLKQVASFKLQINVITSLI